MTQEVSDMQASSCLFRKKLLACAVASVLAGNSLARAQNSSKPLWPPEKTRIIDGNVVGNESAEIPTGKTVSPQAPSNGTATNIVVKNGGILTNKGTITGGQIEQDLTMIEATIGGSNQVINEGTINSATVGSTGDSGSAKAVVKIDDSNSVVTNEGFINVQGTTHDNSGAVGLHIQQGSGTNKEGGKITYANNQGTKAVVVTSGGTFTNQGTITSIGSREVGYGIHCFGCNEIKNEGTIDTAAQNSWAAIDLDFGDNPPAATVTNTGTITGVSGVAIQSDKNNEGNATSVTINNSGNIKTTGIDTHGIVATGSSITYAVTQSGLIETKGAEAYGIQQHSGTLTHSGKTISAFTAIHLSGAFANQSLKFKPGSYVESTASEQQKIAIKGDSDGAYPLHIQGGTFKGAIMAEGDQDHLFIEPPEVVHYIANAPVNIQGNVTGFESVLISGKAWNVSGLVSGTHYLKILDGGQVDKLKVTNSTISPAIGERAFTLVTEAGSSPHNLVISSEATVKELEIGQNGILTNTFNYGTLDTLKVTGANWNVGGWIDKAKTLNTSSTIDHLYVSDVETPVKEPMDMSSRLRLATGNQPLTVAGSAPINDLQIHGKATLAGVGTTEGIKHLSAHSNDTWATSSAITTEKFTAMTGSQVNKALVKNSGDNADTGEKKVTLVTPDGKPLSSFTITQGATVDELALGTNANVIAIDNQGTLNTVSVTANGWQSGIIPDAGKLVSDTTINKLEAGGKDASFTVGSQPNQLAFKTLEKTLDITGSPKHNTSLHVLEGAKLGHVEDVSHTTIGAKDWGGSTLVNPETITISAQGIAGAIASANVINAPAGSSAGNLGVGFSGDSDDDYYFFTLTNSGQVDEVDFSQSKQRPNLLYIQDGGNKNASLRGNAQMTDAIYIKSGDIPPDHQGFAGIGFEGGEWADEAYQDKRLFILGTNNQVTNIKALALGGSDGRALEAPPVSTTENLVFAFSDKQPKRFTLMSAAKEVGNVDFTESNRPDLTYVQMGGLTKDYQGNQSKNDRLVLKGGEFQPGNLDSFKTVVVKGTDWKALGLFSNLDVVKVQDGRLETLHVSGDSSSKGGGKENLNVQTGSGENGKLAVHVKRGQLDEMIVGHNASLGDVTLNGGKVTIAGEGFMRGTFTDAGSLEIKKTQPFVRVGRQLQPGSGVGVLSFNTVDYDLNISGITEIPTVNVFAGGRLGQVEGVDQLRLNTGDDTWFGGILMAKQVSVENGQIDKLKVTNSKTNPMAGERMFTLVTDGYQPNLAIAQGAVVKELTLGQNGAINSITNSGTLDTVSVTADGWQSGIIPDAGKLVSETTINKLSVSGDQAVPAVMPKPNELSFMTTNRSLDIEGSPKHDISLSVLNQAKLGAISGKIQMDVAGKGWKVGQPVQGLENLSVMKGSQFHSLMVSGVPSPTLPAPQPDRLVAMSGLYDSQKLDSVTIQPEATLDKLILGQDSATGMVNNKGTLSLVTTAGTGWKAGLITDASEFAPEHNSHVYAGGKQDLEAKTGVGILTFQTLNQPLKVTGNNHVPRMELLEQAKVGDIGGVDTFALHTKGDTWSASTVMAKNVVVHSGQVDKLKVTNSKTNPVAGEKMFTLVTDGIQPSLTIDKDASIKELVLGQNGAINSITNSGTLDTVSVTADGWQSGIIPDAGKLVSETTINKLSVSGDQAVPAVMPKPNELSFMTTNRSLDIEGSPKHDISLSVLNQAKLGAISGKIQMDVAGKGWKVGQPVQGLENLSVMKGSQFHSLMVSGVPSPTLPAPQPDRLVAMSGLYDSQKLDSVTIQPEATLDKLILGQDSATGMVNNKGTLSLVTTAGTGWKAGLITDASEFAPEHNSHVYAGGKQDLEAKTGVGILTFQTLNQPLKVTGNNHVPRMELLEQAKVGDIGGVDTFALHTKGDTWSASTVMAKNVVVHSGQVDKLKVTNSKTNPVAGEKMFTLVTDGIQPSLTIDKDASIKELVLGQNGAINSITNSGTLDTVSVTADGWQSGIIPDAGKLVSKTTVDRLEAGGKDAHFTAGSQPNQLAFKTLGKTLDITGSPKHDTSLHVLEGAKLGHVEDVSHTTIDAKDLSWSFGSNTLVNPDTITISAQGVAGNIGLSGVVPLSGKSSGGNIPVSFSGDFDPDDYFTITNSGQLTGINFSADTRRPNLRYEQKGGSVDSLLIANPDKADMLVITVGPIPTNTQGFSGKAFNGPGWEMEIWQDQKVFELGSQAGKVDSIKAIGLATAANRRESPAAKSSHLIFTFTNQQPKHFALFSATEVDSVDFSESNRPSLSYIQQEGGVTKDYKGNLEKNDRLVLRGGEFQPGNVDSFKTVVVKGTDWKAQGLFRNLDAVNVEGGRLETLYVSGDASARKVDKGSLNVRTGAGNDGELSVYVNKGQLGEMIVGHNANLGEVTLNGGKITIDGGGIMSDLITNAGELETRGRTPVVHINAGSSLQPGSGIGVLSFNTIDHGLKVTGTTPIPRMNLYSGAQLLDIAGVQEVSVNDPIRMEGSAITNAQTLLVNTDQDRLHVGSSAVIPPEDTRSHISMITTDRKQPLSIASVEEGSGTIGQLFINEGARLGNVATAKDIQVTGSDWTVGGMVADPVSMDVTGVLDEIIASDVVTPDQKDRRIHLRFSGNHGDDDVFTLSSRQDGNIKTANFSSNINRPSLYFIQDGGTTETLRGNPQKMDVLELRKGSVSNVSGFANASITSGDWERMDMENPISLVVAEGGTATIIEDGRVPLAKTAKESTTVHLTFSDISTQAGRINSQEKEENREFVITNTTGGHITDLRLSSGERSKRLNLLQAGGTTGDISASQNMGDRVILEAGSTGTMTGVDELLVTGSNWTTGVVHDPAIVSIGALPEGRKLAQQIQATFNMKPAPESTLSNIMTMSSGVKVSKITTTMDNGTVLKSRTGLLMLDLQGRQLLESGQAVTQIDIKNGAEVNEVDLSDTSGRGGVNINLEDGKLHTIKANRDKDGLNVTQGSVTGQGSGLKTVDVSGHLTLTSNSNLSDISDYRQAGTLTVSLVPAAEKTDENEKPVVQAATISFGDSAWLELDGMSDTDIGSSYLVMRADDSISGLPRIEQPPSLRYTHYGPTLAGNDLRVTGSSMGGYISGLAAQGQADEGAQRAIEAAINPKGPSVTLETVNDPLNDWTRQQTNAVNNEPVAVANIARQMKPDNSGASVSGARAGLQQSGKAIAARQSAQRTGISTGDMVANGNLWIQYAYNNATQKEKDGIYGYEATTHGFTLGADADLNDTNNFGAAYTYSKGDIKGKDGSQSSFDTTGHIFSIYGTLGVNNTPAFIDTQLSYGRGENDGKRRVDGASEVKAKYNTNSWYLGVLGGYPMPMGTGDWSWVPQAAFNYANIETDDYQEEGGNIPSGTIAFDKVSTSKYEIMEVGLGLKVVGDITKNNMVFKPEASFMAYHDFKDDPVTMTAHYAAGGNSFVVHGAKRDTTRMQVGLGAEMEMNNNLSLSASYDYNWMDTFSSHSFKIKGKYSF